MPGRDHAGITPARLQGYAGVLLDKHDIMPILLKLVGSGYADDPATHH
jgi:hypothetical protein